MPLLYDDNTVRSHYRQAQPQVRVDGVAIDPKPPFTYGLNFPVLLDQQTTRKDWLTGYGLDNNAAVLCIGAGFGYLIDNLRTEGIEAWGLEGGSFYWDAANAGEWPAGIQQYVANDWLGSGTEVASLDALPGVPNNERFSWIVDEDAAVCHTDAELPAFIAACEARLQGNAKSRIVHIVTDRTVEQGPFTDPQLNAKTIEEWSLVAPDHTWVRGSDGSVWRNGAQVAF